MVKPGFIDLNKIKKNPLSEYIKKHVFENKRNYNILITGKTQMRKSTTALRLAYDINKNFDVQKHCAVIFAEDFIELLKNQELKRGDVVIADDFGVGLNHRNWYSQLNKALNYVLQTHGYRGIICIVTTPYESYIDSDARLLFDMHIKITRKDDKNSYVVAKVVELQHVKIENKMRTYQWYLRAKKGDKIYRVERFKIKYAPRKIMNEYFKVANEAKMKLQEKHAMELRAKEVLDKRTALNVEECVEKIRKDVKKFLSQHPITGKYYLDINLLMSYLDLGRWNAQKVKSVALKDPEITKFIEKINEEGG